MQNVLHVLSAAKRGPFRRVAAATPLVWTWAFDTDALTGTATSGATVSPTFARTSDAWHRDPTTGLVVKKAANGVALEKIGGRTGIRLDPARNNILKNSRDLTDATKWTAVASGIITRTETGADGTANTATTIEDDSEAARGHAKQTQSVDADTKWHCASVLIKKRDVANLAGLGISISGGTAVQGYMNINQKTGECGAGPTIPPTLYGVIDYNTDWWQAWCAVQNNGSVGNTAAAIMIYPALAESINGNGSNTPKGTVIVDFPQLETDSAYPSNVTASGADATFARAITSLTYPSLATLGLDPTDHVVFMRFLPQPGIDNNWLRLWTFNDSDGANYIARTIGGVGYALTPVANGGYSLMLKLSDLLEGWNTIKAKLVKEGDKIRCVVVLNGTEKYNAAVSGALGGMKGAVQFGAYGTANFCGIISDVRIASSASFDTLDA